MNKRDTGYKSLKRDAQNSFEKRGEYMKRAMIAEAKVKKLKELMLLTDKKVLHIQVGETQIIQWTEFTSAFPDEKIEVQF